MAVLVQAGDATAVEPWDKPSGRFCLNSWISEAVELLNAYDGDAAFNDGKPWTVNEFGQFVPWGTPTGTPPEDWADYGGKRHAWMWSHYGSAAGGPDPQWPDDSFSDAGLETIIPGWFCQWLRTGDLGTQAETAAGDDSGYGNYDRDIMILVPPWSLQKEQPSVEDFAQICVNCLRLDTDAICPPTFEGLGETTAKLICYCPPGDGEGQVWGTWDYTAHSSICGAARHIGAVGDDGGMVGVRGQPGRESYHGIELNGVVTEDFGAFPWGFYFISDPVMGGRDPHDIGR